MDEIAKFRFEWRGAQFTWVPRPGRFESDANELDWSANVSPEGLAWDALLTFGGGTMAAVGTTPQLALEAARQLWVDRVTQVFG